MYANATIAPAGIPAVHQNIGIVPGEFTTLMDSIFGAIGGPRPAPSIGNIPGGVPGIPNIQNEPPVIPSFPGNIFGSGSVAHNNHGSPSSGVPGNIFGP